MIEVISGKQFPEKVIPLIEDAKKSIDIIVFDWRWYPSEIGSSVQLFNQAIIRAVRRGVKIRAIVNNNDIINFLLSLGCQAKKLLTKKIVHVKLMIIDEAVVIVGSHNYTMNAFTMNFELSVILEPGLETKKFLEFFKNLYNQ